MKELKSFICSIEYKNRNVDNVLQTVIHKQYSFSVHVWKLHVFIKICFIYTARMNKLENHCGII